MSLPRIKIEVVVFPSLLSEEPQRYNFKDMRQLDEVT
jgi:hypothetical protein